MAFSNNILDQRNLQVTVQPEELQLNKFLIDRAADAIFWVNSEERFLYVNAAACCMTGYSREELLSMTMHDVNPDFSVEVWLEHWRIIKQQGALTFESLHRTKEGWSFPVEITVTYLEYYGREYGCIFVRDITKRKQLEVSLKDNEALEARFRTWAETTDAIIFIIQGTQIRYANPAAEAITGYKRAELLTHPALRPLLEIKESRRVRQRCSSGFPQYQEFKILTKNGEERWLDCSVGVFEFEGKQALLVTAIDITKRKQSEVEIRAALEQEKELGGIRARFVSMVSHEFRNPLHIISFSTSLLKRHSHQWTEEKKLKYLDRIQTAVEQLSQLIDGILVIGRAEAGKLIFEPRALDLNQFCRNLVAEIQLSDSSSQHAITFVSLGDCLTVCLDEKLLRPMLTNLLDNAVKYSPPGSTIDLTLSYLDGEVIFQIKDRGIGIPTADRQQLFEPFHRGRNVGDVPGTGLGLVVVKKLVDIQGGQIVVASEVGVGTTFTIRLPLGKSLAAEASAPLILSTDQR